MLRIFSVNTALVLHILTRGRTQVTTHAARQELAEDMRGVDGGARIEKKIHLHHGQAQTSMHKDQDALSVACRGQGSGERTCLKDRLEDAPPPAVALSSLVQQRCR